MFSQLIASLLMALGVGGATGDMPKQFNPQGPERPAIVQELKDLDPEDRQERRAELREEFDNMTDEKREAKREEMRAQHEADREGLPEIFTEEEREAHQAERQALHEAMRAAETDEEREALKAEAEAAREAHRTEVEARIAELSDEDQAAIEAHRAEREGQKGQFGKRGPNKGFRQGGPGREGFGANDQRPDFREMLKQLLEGIGELPSDVEVQ